MTLAEAFEQIQIRADDRREFVEWLKTHGNSDGYIEIGRLDELLAKYEKGEEENDE